MNMPSRTLYKYVQVGLHTEYCTNTRTSLSLIRYKSCMENNAIEGLLEKSWNFFTLVLMAHCLQKDSYLGEFIGGLFAGTSLPVATVRKL